MTKRVLFLGGDVKFFFAVTDEKTSITTMVTGTTQMLGHELDAWDKLRDEFEQVKYQMERA